MKHLPLSVFFFPFFEALGMHILGLFYLSEFILLGWQLLQKKRQNNCTKTVEIYPCSFIDSYCLWELSQIKWCNLRYKMLMQGHKSYAILMQYLCNTNVEAYTKTNACLTTLGCALTENMLWNPGYLSNYFYEKNRIF